MDEAKNSAALCEKIVIQGELCLDAPLRIGSGEGGNREADVYVMKNRSQNPIIPGSSLAGVMRSACKSLDIPNILNIIFGSDHEEVSHGKASARQSAIDVNDVILKDFEIVIRDGVAINPCTGTAMDGSKHDYEAVERGAHGKLSITISIRQEDMALRDEIESASRKIASILTQGIRLGSMTSKGFGLAHCPKVTVDFYDFALPEAVKAWILKDACATETMTFEQNSIYPSENFIVDMDLAIRGSLMVRSATDKKRGEMPIKAEQLQHRDRDGNTAYYIIPGTSIKGALRNHALKILDRLGLEQGFLKELMGNADQKRKSRFLVNEAYIDKDAGVHEHLQARNSIDRFTGGVMPGKLFGESPIWQDASDCPTLKLHFEIKPALCGKQRAWDLGLTMFLIKDLCLGHIALGGEKSIGRGTLKGCRTVIHYNTNTYEIDGDGCVSGDDAAERLVEMEDWANNFLKGQAGGSNE